MSAHRERIGRHGLTLIRSISVAAATFLLGCSVIPQYPASLPALLVVDSRLESCPPIAGTFSDLGTAIAPDGRVLGSVSMTNLLHPSLASGKADSVVVSGPACDVVEIESFAGKERLVTWRQSKFSKEAYLAKGDPVLGETYACEDGFVRLGRANDSGEQEPFGQFVMWAKSDFLWLRKATDGSLIALHSMEDVWVVDFVLPVVNTKKIWYRFQPPTPPAQSSPDDLLRRPAQNEARP